MTLIETKQVLSFPKKTGRPQLNESIIPVVPGIFDVRTNSVRLLMKWVKLSPEPLGIVNRISRDVVTPVSFKKVEKTSKSGTVGGRPKLNSIAETKAMEFYKKHFFRQVDKDAVVDELITGDSFVWKGRHSDEQIKDVVKELYKRSGLEFKETEFKARDFLDEDSQGISDVQHVPSTTMTIAFDKTEILGYRQIVINAAGNTESEEFTKDTIIHGTFMRMDGKVYGFTPMSASIPVIKTLGLLKDYLGNFFSGGGTPDWFLIFEENLDISTRQLLEQRFQEYKDNRKRGHMVVDGGGKVTLQQINDFDKDMEFYKLAMYYTGVLAHAFNMPASFLGPIIGSIVKQTSGGVDSSEGAYWKSIQSYQEYREDLYNTQLWIPFFGVEMKYNKPYLIDEIKESQNKMFINDGLAKTAFIYAKYEKRLKKSVIDRLLGFEEADFEELPEEEKMAMQAQSFGSEFGNRQNQPDNQSISGGKAKEGQRQAKRDEAKKN